MGLDISIYKNKEDLGYFRKVNFLVSYFEIRGYELENLVPVEISKNDIIELKERCKLISNNHELAEELLPTCSGFFFGGTEYDEYYFENIDDVYNWCEFVIPLIEESDKLEFEIWY